MNFKNQYFFYRINKRLMNGVAIKYNFYDIFNYLIFQLKKDKLLDEYLNLYKFKIEVIVISLSFRIDRRSFIEEQFNRLKFPFSFFNAIHGITERNEVYQLLNLSKYSKKFLSAGSIGGIATSIQLWNNLVKSNNDGYLVFEDDVILKKNYEELKLLFETVPKKFDIVYLGSGSYKSRINIKKVSQTLGRPFSIRKGSYGYLISKNGARKILNEINEISITCGGIDTILGLLIMRNKISAYHFLPEVCTVNQLFTSNVINLSKSHKEIDIIELI